MPFLVIAKFLFLCKTRLKIGCLKICGSPKMSYFGKYCQYRPGSGLKIFCVSIPKTFPLTPKSIERVETPFKENEKRNLFFRHPLVESLLKRTKSYVKWWQIFFISLERMRLLGSQCGIKFVAHQFSYFKCPRLILFISRIK